MKQFVLLALVVGVALANVDLDEHWQTFKTTYNKSYTEGEEYVRRAAWEENVRLIIRHNLNADLGKYSYRLGLNEYSDLTDEEHARYLRGAKQPDHFRVGAHKFQDPLYTQLPSTVDWRKQGYVTPVKNQGQCGSCWTFSSTGSMEGQHFRATGRLVSLSEQNIIDCSKPEGGGGCNGGWMDYAFEYVMRNGGIDTEASYPYEAKDGSCRYQYQSRGAGVWAFADIQKYNETALKVAVATQGPISVAIDATSREFGSYKNGIFNYPACSSENTDHAVLVVGYGSLNGQDYWLVKNSWGTSWGQNGYIMMSRNKRNQCAIASFASFPLMKETV